MPLNPPSYKGQDVWYSPNVYINKVPAALWLPPKIGDSLIFQFTLPPDTTEPPPPASVVQFWSNTEQQNAQNPYTQDAEVVAGGDAGSTISVVTGDAPPKGATADNPLGEPEIAASPLQLPPGSGPWQTLNANLDAALSEAAQGKWTTRYTSQNVKACFAELGRLNTYPNVWCAAFANTILKRSGISYLKNDLLAFSFRNKQWGKPIAVNDYEAWRYNDLVVFNFSHVAFVRGIDLQKRQIQVVGGNQKDNLSQINFKQGSLGQICYVARGWEIPPEIDKPILTTLKPGTPVVSPGETR